MLRNLTVIAVLLAAMLPTGSSAAVAPYSAVNLHNGFIEVRSHVVVKNYGEDVSASALVHVNLRRTDGTLQDYGQVGSTAPIYFNTCCIVAGTLYIVEATVQGHKIDFRVRPKLCNVRGIPFGFEIVTVTGNAERDRNNNWVVNIQPHVLEAPCPTN